MNVCLVGSGRTCGIAVSDRQVDDCGWVQSNCWLGNRLAELGSAEIATETAVLCGLHLLNRVQDRGLVIEGRIRVELVGLKLLTTQLRRIRKTLILQIEARQSKVPGDYVTTQAEVPCGGSCLGKAGTGDLILGLLAQLATEFEVTLGFGDSCLQKGAATVGDWGAGELRKVWASPDSSARLDDTPAVAVRRK